MELITVNYDNLKLLNEVTTTNLLVEYADVFDGGLGTLPGKVHLHVEEGARHVQCPARHSANYTEAEAENRTGSRG